MELRAHQTILKGEYNPNQELINLTDYIPDDPRPRTKRPILENDYSNHFFLSNRYPLQPKIHEEM